MGSWKVSRFSEKVVKLATLVFNHFNSLKCVSDGSCTTRPYPASFLADSNVLPLSGATTILESKNSDATENNNNKKKTLFGSRDATERRYTEHYCQELQLRKHSSWQWIQLPLCLSNLPARTNRRIMGLFRIVTFYLHVC